MLGLLWDVTGALTSRGVAHALIGAGALTVHGVSRSTFDLDLLKLFAGGPQDAWDIEQLLAPGVQAEVVAGVERQLPRLPVDAARLWRRVNHRPEPGS